LIKMLINTSNVTIKLACELLSYFIDKSKTESVWANGINFDISILEHMYGQVGLHVPWKYNAVRDYRTYVKSFDWVSPKTTYHNGTKHNALDDAIYQARTLYECQTKVNKAVIAGLPHV
jgi:hypothetical protein